MQDLKGVSEDELFALLRGATAGSSEREVAVTEAVRRFGSTVRWVAWSVLGRRFPGAVDEAAQEAWTKFDGELRASRCAVGSERALLRSIARTAAIDVLRKEHSAGGYAGTIRKRESAAEAGAAKTTPATAKHVPKTAGATGARLVRHDVPDFELTATAVPGDRPSPEVAVIRQQLWQALKDCLDAIQDRRHTFAYMKTKYVGEKQATVAALLDVTTKSVRDWNVLTQKELGACLNGKGFGVEAVFDAYR